jgi:GAF domain-containing protein
VEQSRVVQLAQELSSRLSPGDLDQTLRRITEAAVEVLPGVDFASITVKHPEGRLETVAPTSDILMGIDAAQYELREGPCYEAAVDVAHRVSPDLEHDERYPNYGPVAVAAGIRAQAGIRLFDTPRQAQGALNLYSSECGSFAGDQALAELFSHQAATAIRYASEVSDLREAMLTRQLIGQAVGIIMERYELPDARAFAFLTRLSNERNVKLRLIAQELVAASEQRHDDDLEWR